MRTKGSKNKPFVLDLSGFKLLKEAAAKVPPLVGTKEELINQRLDRIEAKLDQLLNGKLIYEK